MKKQNNYKKSKIKALIGLLSLITLITVSPKNIKSISKINSSQNSTTLDANNNKSLEKLYNYLAEDLNINEQKDLLTKLKYLLSFKKINLDYSEYVSVLDKDFLTINELNNMVPQGITIYEDYTLFSSYDSTNEKNSCIFVLDKDSNIINKAYLDNNSHVGGITYDDENDLLWVTVNRGVSAYDINDIITKENVIAKYYDKVIEELNRCSFITYYNNKLYIGTYKYCGTSTLREYSIPILNKSEIKLTKENTFTIPSKIQGVTFLESNNQTYMILSSSYSKSENSYITVYNYNAVDYNYLDNYLTKIECPPMLEEICLNNNNDLLTLYESGATKYKKCLSNMKHIYCIDTNKLLKK